MNSEIDKISEFMALNEIQSSHLDGKNGLIQVEGRIIMPLLYCMDYVLFYQNYWFSAMDKTIRIPVFNKTCWYCPNVLCSVFSAQFSSRANKTLDTSEEKTSFFCEKCVHDRCALGDLMLEYTNKMKKTTTNYGKRKKYTWNT